MANKLNEIREHFVEGIKEEANRMLEESKFRQALDAKNTIYTEEYFPTIVLHMVEARVRGSRIRKGPGKGQIRLTWFPTNIEAKDNRREQMLAKMFDQPEKGE